MVRTLAPVSRYLVAAPNYLSKYGRPSHPLHLSEHRCITYVSTPGETWHFSNAAGETAAVRPVGPFRVNNGDAMLPSLTAGVSLGILPEFIVQQALATGRLEIVLPEWTSSGGSVHWLTPPGGPRPKRVEVLGAEPTCRRGRCRRWNCSDLFSGGLDRRCNGGDVVTETALHVVTPLPWPIERRACR